MNERLASILQEVGRSPIQLARALNKKLPVPISKAAPYKWLRQGSTPRGLAPQYIAEILTEWSGRRVTVTELGWGPHFPVPSISDSLKPWGATSVIQSLGEELLGEGVNRRVFLEQGGLDLARMANPWLIDPVDEIAASNIEGKRVNRATVQDIEYMTAIRRRLDDQLGAGTQLAPAREDFKVTVTLLKRARYDETIGRMIMAAGAEQGRLLSWLSYDAGQHGLAQYYTRMALQLAHSAGARDVGANILGFAAYQAGSRGDAVACESFSRAALAGARGTLTPAVEGSIQARLGMARARMLDHNAAAAAFGEAEELLSRSEPDNEPVWIYWFTPEDLWGIAGESDLVTGRSESAIDRLRHAADGTSEDLTRDKALWLSSLATAYAVGGDLEQGRDTAEQALNILSGNVESERVFGVFEGFCDAVRLQDPRSAEEFHDRLVAHVTAEDERV